MSNDCGNPLIAKWMSDEIDRCVLEKMSRMDGDEEVPPEWILNLKEYSMYLPVANSEAILKSDRNSAGIYEFPARKKIPKP